MDVYDVIIEQLNSFEEQLKEIGAGNKNKADFLEKANTILTIDRYIKILADDSYAQQSDIKQLQKAWQDLLKNVHI